MSTFFNTRPCVTVQVDVRGQHNPRNFPDAYYFGSNATGDRKIVQLHFQDTNTILSGRKSENVPSEGVRMSLDGGYLG